MMTVIAFKIRFDEVVAKIDYEYNYGFDINSYVREMELLCHNFLYLNNKEKKEKNRIKE